MDARRGPSRGRSGRAEGVKAQQRALTGLRPWVKAGQRAL